MKPIYLVLPFLLSFTQLANAGTPPEFSSPPTASSNVPLVGQTITFNAPATDPQNLPLALLYDYGDGATDGSGSHVYAAPGVYIVTITATNCTDSAATSLQITVKGFTNLWIAKQSLKVGPKGDSWSAKFIYNADRTSAGIFNPAKELLLSTVGELTGIQINPAQFLKSRPKFAFKSAKGVTPSVAVTLDESSQTISVSAKGATFNGKIAQSFFNVVQLGSRSWAIDTALDVKNRFVANASYRSAAFVVSKGSVKIKAAGKDSANFSLLLGDPAFKFPGASGAKTVRVRMINSAGTVVIDKDFTSAATVSGSKFKSGKDTATPAGKFKYDGLKGKMSAILSKATLGGLLSRTEEHVRIDVILGDQTYSTAVTLFAPKSGAYTTKMGKGAGPVPTTPGEAIFTSPTVVATNPVTGATGVARNQVITAEFSKPMDTSTINSGSFALRQGTTLISGVIAFSGTSATLTPDQILAPNAVFTASITTAVKDVAGNAMAGNFLWCFTTGATADTTAPNIISTNPSDLATNVAVDHTVNATFDEAMDPLSINTTNFTLAGPGPITGTVAYDALNKIATFTPSSNLALNTLFTATVSTGVKDQAGNAMAVNKVWTFTTGTQKVIHPVALGAAAPFGTFGGGAGMTNQGILTVVNGNIGTTGASTTVTGFHDSRGDIYTETPLNKGQVNGEINTDGPPPGGAGVGGNASTMSIATQALADANTAFNNLSPASMPGGTDPGAGQLGGLTLPPGIYKSTGATFQITGSDLTLDGQGDSNAVFVFQMAASLTVGGPAAPRTVNLINGAQAKNVFWRVGSAATINEAGGGTMVGTIIASAGITFSTAGNVTLVTLNGRALGLNASTTLVNTIINTPAP